MLEVELLALDAMAARGEVPQEAVDHIRRTARFDVDRIDTLERTLKHDVIAFLTAVGENVGPEARYIHKGMTSSDVLDTAFSLQLRDAGRLLLASLDRVMAAVRTQALTHRLTLCMGRSHGIHAEPTTFGLKLAVWYDELSRHRMRLLAAIDDISVGMISGAVGTFAFVHPEIEESVCRALGLKPEAASTQIISRDRHAHFFSTLALIASSIEKFATEIRHLQRTEVLEAEEPFTSGQKGSSAMPHKRNPILSENLTGCARLMRSYAIAAQENIALWHERDISHSSVERVIGPDATILLHFMLHRFAGLMEGLVVYPENMQANLERLGGIFYSQRVLLYLVDRGFSREDAYSRVQEAAMRVWQGEGPLRAQLEASPELQPHLSSEVLDSLFDPKAYIQHVDVVFGRVFGPAALHPSAATTRPSAPSTQQPPHTRE
jgi:adenylosuccinate lyase